MKKFFLFLMVAILCVGIIAGCGGKSNNGGTSGDDAPKVKGTVHDAGNVSALVPEGWMQFDVIDLFAEEDGAIDPNAMNIYKGAKSDFDILTHPGLMINYYGPETDMMAPFKELYDEVEDLEEFTLGNYTWSGFSGKSMDLPITILWADDGEGNEFQVSIWTETTEGSISLEDADVRAIIESISISE